MIQAKTSFQNDEEMRAYIFEAETLYNDQLSEAAAYILSQKEHRIITLSGPSCSGKTTTGRKLIERLSAMGERVHLVSLDDFFLPRDLLLSRAADNGGKIDFDSPNTLDYEALSSVIADIRASRTVRLPKFSFLTGKREGEETVIPQENDLFLFEGIQAVYPEVTEHIHCGYKRVQISVATDVEVNGKFFTSRQIRFLRRMIRDAKFRCAPPEVTFEMWKGVSENEDLHIMPFAGKYDIELDSYMEYEPFMIKNQVEALLKSVNPSYKFYHKAEEILAKIKDFFEISPEYLPDKSVYHEFLG